jgi:transposase homolog for IS232
MLTLEDLPKLKIFADNSNIKVNFSKIAKELGKDRRTVKKYYYGFKKTKIEISDLNVMSSMIQS